MNRLIGTAIGLGLMGAALLFVQPCQAAMPEPVVTLLDLHPVDQSYSPGAKPVAVVMPKIVRQGRATMPDPMQIQVPINVSPSQRENAEPGAPVGKAGTGFFIGSDGTLLTAAHVVTDCRRMQIISKFVPRTWVSVQAMDRTQDLAILKASDLRPPGVVRIATTPPVSKKLLVLGYPAPAGLTAAAETWAEVQNQKFPASIGPLANPRELLWMSAPDVTHGFSGGPIFDPRLRAVVGVVKGEVDGGYLRLVRDMPTTGVAIGPGIGNIGAFLRREVPFSAVALTASSGDTGEDTLRRATVHVLCWP